MVHLSKILLLAVVGACALAGCNAGTAEGGAEPANAQTGPKAKLPGVGGGPSATATPSTKGAE